MESARPATPADVPEVSRLWREAVADLDGQRGGSLLARSLTRPDLDGWVAGALADPDRQTVLGYIERTPVGLASAVADRSARGVVAVVELIFVEVPARHVGVAEAMLDVVAARAGEWGAIGLDAPALPGSRAAKSFFEVHGFQARLLVMHRPLAP